MNKLERKDISPSEAEEIAKEATKEKPDSKLVMLESTLYEKLRMAIKTKRDMTLIRIENSVISGLSDCLLLCNGKCLPVELKRVIHGHILIRKFQWSMMERFTAASVPYFVICVDAYDLIRCYKASHLLGVGGRLTQKGIIVKLTTVDAMVFYENLINLDSLRHALEQLPNTGVR